MIRVSLISPEAPIREQLTASLRELSGIVVQRCLDHYPEELTMERFLRAIAPDVLFVSAQTMSGVERVLYAVELLAPGLPIVLIGQNCSQQLLIDAMELGVRYFLPYPFETAAVGEIVQRALARLEQSGKSVAPSSTDQIYTFLPAKPGVGTSTVTLNTAHALAQVGVPTLVGDFDLNSGMIRFMLKLEHSTALLDAIDHAEKMDEDMWSELVQHVHDIDVLYGGFLDHSRGIDLPYLRTLLAFLRRNYQAICLDLSGNMEKYSIELMHQSKQVFLVTTPEMPSLHWARERFRYLESLELGPRVGVLLNRRQQPMTMSEEEIAELVGAPLMTCFDNHYRTTQKALALGQPVSLVSSLGMQYAEFAAQLSGHTAPPPRPRKKRFIQRVATVSSRS